MENAEHLSSYLVILKICQKAYYRNLILAGGLLVMTFLATTATLLFTEWNARSIWLMGMFDGLILIGFLMAWTRLEITKENIELLNNLQQRDD